MLKGKELGVAIKQAIDLKIASGAIANKADVARHFGIKAPSVYDWIKKGSISKDKLVKLWDFFSDVVGPEHWGIDSGVYQAAKIGTTPSILKQNGESYGEHAETLRLNNEEKLLILSFRKRRRDLQLAVLRSLDVQPIDFAKSA